VALSYLCLAGAFTVGQRMWDRAVGRSSPTGRRRGRMSTTRSGRATLTAFRAGGHYSAGDLAALCTTGQLALAARPPKPLRQWAINARVVTGAQPGSRTATAPSCPGSAIRSARCSSTVHPRPDCRKVDVDPGQLEAHAHIACPSRTVIAIPHMGRWDLAGPTARFAACPVTSVCRNDCPPASTSTSARCGRSSECRSTPMTRHGPGRDAGRRCAQWTRRLLCVQIATSDATASQ
jgi:hypothetical protein